MARNYKKCDKCERDISLSNCKKHSSNCDGSLPKPKQVVPTDLTCRFCNIILKNKNSFLNHERLCNNNPDKKHTYFKTHAKELTRTKKYKNQFDKAKKLGLPKPEITDSTRLKLKAAYKNKEISYASKESKKFIKELILELPELSKYELYHSEDKHEYVLNLNGKKYCYDFCIPEIKLIIEYNGAKFHPRENDIDWISPFGVSYEQALTLDKLKEKIAIDNGFTILYCWSDTYLNDKEIIKESIKQNIIASGPAR